MIEVSQETLSITVVSGSSQSKTILIEQGLPTVEVLSANGPPGPPGPSGSGYNHTQSSASTVWTINHNLGFIPTVQTVTVGGLEVMGEVQHTSANQTLVTFNTAIAGTARLA
jgi:hypothetical protein